MDIEILHLSDIHTGPGEVEDQDLKDYLPESNRQTLLERLTEYLKALPRTPDYVVVSGDITLRGRPEGFATFRSWLIDRINERTLPQSERIMVVPGNHDVKWKIPEQEPGWHKKRYESFFANFGSGFPHAYIPDWDPPLPDPAEFTIAGTERVVGGLKTDIDFGKLKVTSSLPFILDLDNDLLIFAFNSSLASGIYLPSKGFVKTLSALMEAFNGNRDLSEKLTQMREEYLDSTVVDAGLIGEEQLKYFSQLMVRLKEQLGERYQHLTKVAVLHHHVTHLLGAQLEVKRFEAVVDVSQLKQYLTEHEFDLVLHGHKHMNQVSIDGSIVPTSVNRRYSPLCVVSAGTIGGPPRLSDRQTFKIISLHRSSGPRVAADVREIPLLLTGNPRTIISQETKIYPIPISSRVPELHDNAALKDALDARLLTLLAPETSQSGGVLTTGGQIHFPVGDPTIVQEQSSYKFHRTLETTEGITYYDLMLGTEHIGFVQRARIFWMLADVSAHANRINRPVKVVLLIGILENTHFSRTTAAGEVENSIQKIEQWFAPARERQLFEIRRYDFQQGEVEAISREVAVKGSPNRASDD